MSSCTSSINIDELEFRGDYDRVADVLFGRSQLFPDRALRPATQFNGSFSSLQNLNRFSDLKVSELSSSTLKKGSLLESFAVLLAGEDVETVQHRFITLFANGEVKMRKPRII